MELTRRWPKPCEASGEASDQRAGAFSKAIGSCLECWAEGIIAGICALFFMYIIDAAPLIGGECGPRACASRNILDIIHGHIVRDEGAGQVIGHCGLDSRDED